MLPFAGAGTGWGWLPWLLAFAALAALAFRERRAAKTLREALAQSARLGAEILDSRQTLAKLEILISQVRDYAIFMLDPQGNVTSWNIGAERLKGYAKAEILGRHFSVFYPEEDAAAGKPAQELAQAEVYGTYQEDGWRVRKDGTRFLAHVVVTALRDPSNALLGFVKVTRDVTMEKDSEERMASFARELEETVEARTRELQDSEARLQGFIRHATSAIAFKDAEGRYLLLNPVMAAMLGRSQEDILGRTDLDLLPPPRNAAVALEDRKVLASGQALEMERHWVHPDGSKHDYLAQKFPLADAGGNGWGIGVICTDITERKAAEQVRLQSQKLESLGVLAGGIAHDFNNFLGAILGNLGLAQMEIGPTSPARARLETIESLVGKATSLTRQLLAYSGRGTFEIKPLDLNALVQEMTHLLAISISKKVTTRYRLDPSAPFIQADASQIQQVIMNLVINASDAIGDRPGTITISTAPLSADLDYLERTFQGQTLQPGTFVALEVTDDGSGMTAETLKRIFEPFFTTKFSGRGLGLSAIQGIIKGHGAGLRVYSEVGRGTTFKAIFPATAAQPDAPPRAHAVEGFHGSGTILVVDDEESIRAMSSGILAQMGFDVVLAADGMEALMLFETHKADIRLVIMDLTMPNMDGAEAFAALRKRGHAIPVVLTSGFNENEAVARFQGEGLAGFLQKPYRVSAFVEVVKQALLVQPKSRTGP
jgi:PAS domain S-box-containing protein